MPHSLHILYLVRRENCNYHNSNDQICHTTQQNDFQYKTYAKFDHRGGGGAMCLTVAVPMTIHFADRSRGGVDTTAAVVVIRYSADCPGVVKAVTAPMR